MSITVSNMHNRLVTNDFNKYIRTFEIMVFSFYFSGNHIYEHTKFVNLWNTI